MRFADITGRPLRQMPVDITDHFARMQEVSIIKAKLLFIQQFDDVPA